MNRAMFSGVAGLKTHQTKMDVIGNNIANVNTYGFKSQRAVFSDIYYQNIKNASAGTTSRGGTNPSSVGYGSSVSAIQTQMTQSSMQNTGFGMDVAIMGEGFLQVMDPDGNTFYTKAGLLDYDANGYLTDINGNFVLGATSVDGKPGSQKIRLDNIGSVEAQKPAITEKINGVDYTITASNATKYGNVSISLGSSEQLPAGLKASADISPTGAISVKLNAYEKFSSMAELNSAVNAAIKEANNGKAHAAGTFTITASENKFGTDATPGTWTGAGAADSAKLTPADISGLFGGALSFSSIDLAKFPAADATENMTLTKVVNGADTSYTLSMAVNGIAYTGTFKGDIALGGTIDLKETSGKKITMKVSDKNKLTTQLTKLANNGDKADAPVKQTPPQYFFGGSSIASVSASFSGQGPMHFTYALNAGNYEITANVGGKEYKGSVSATAGGTVTLKTTGDEAVDGSITMTVPSKTDMMAKYGIDPKDTGADAALTTKLNASLDKQNYVAVPASAGSSTPLTGAEIAGINFGTKPGTIMGFDDGAFGGGMTFKKTSSDFKGKGQVTSNDFKATYEDNGVDPASWKVTMAINGVNYSSEITKNTLASSLLLKSGAGDYVEVTNPGFDAMNTYFKQLNPGTDPTHNAGMSALTGNTTLNVSPSTPSKDLGLNSTNFTLAGGTEGGAITLDQLSSISIGSDGTISVSHAEKGTVVAGKISLASFANPSGLQSEGSNYYSSTANSGTAKLCDPGSDGTGGLKGSALEMSNVDLSAEFADMITTQRGFQANSRIITVSDAMLEELINLKR